MFQNFTAIVPESCPKMAAQFPPVRERSYLKARKLNVAGSMNEKMFCVAKLGERLLERN